MCHIKDKTGTFSCLILSATEFNSSLDNLSIKSELFCSVGLARLYKWMAFKLLSNGFKKLI